MGGAASSHRRRHPLNKATSFTDYHSRSDLAAILATAKILGSACLTSTRTQFSGERCLCSVVLGAQPSGVIRMQWWPLLGPRQLPCSRACHMLTTSMPCCSCARPASSVPNLAPEPHLARPTEPPSLPPLPTPTIIWERQARLFALRPTAPVLSSCSTSLPSSSRTSWPLAWRH